MKKFLCLLTALLTSFASQANIYRSIDAEVDARLVILPAEHSDQFLISFDGFKHEFDRQTMLYEKHMNTNDARDGYYYKMVGTPYTTVRNNQTNTLLMGSIIPYIEVHLANRAPVKMVFTEQSDTAMQQRVQQRYLQQQGHTVSRIEAKKQINQAMHTLQTECNTNIKVQIDWDAFAEPEHTTPALAARYIQALNKICLQDDDYKQAVQTITVLTFGRAKNQLKHQVKRNDQEVSIQLAKDSANISATSYIQLMDLF